MNKEINRKVVYVLWVISLVVNGEKEALVGYNCSHTDIAIKEFSLLNENKCPEFKELAIQEKIAIQLVQRREYKYAHAYSMMVERTLRVMRCDGYHVTHEVTQRVLTLSQNQVMEAYESKHFRDEYVTLGNLNFNGSMVWTGNLRGWTDTKGYCGGETIKLHGLTYENSVLAAGYAISMMDGLVTVNLEADRIELFGGTSCKYSDQTCVSLTVGDVYWQTSQEDDKCTPFLYPVLYEGEALISRYPATAVTEAKQIVTMKSNEYAFSLVITEGKMLCAQQAYGTEHPALFLVLVSRLGLKYFQRHEMHPFDINSNTYRDSKFIFVERHLQRQLTQLNNVVMAQICKMELQVLANLRATAAIDANQFGYAYKKQPGYTALIRGEVLYLIRCVPVRVYWRPAGLCYQEIPVSYLNISCFLNPRTRILTHFSEEVPCSSQLPVKFKLQNIWVAMSPTVVRSTAPGQLTLGMNLSAWNYEHVDMTLGIYSAQDLERQRAAVLHPLEYNAITRTIAANAGGFSKERQGLNMLNMMDPVQLKQVVVGHWEALTGKFKIFGAYSGGIIMIVFIYKAVAQACQGGIHFAAVKRIFGLGMGLVACVCPALANLALIYGQEDRKNSGNKKATVKGAFKEFQRVHTGEIETAAVREEQALYPLAEIRTLGTAASTRGGEAEKLLKSGNDDQGTRQ